MNPTHLLDPLVESLDLHFGGGVYYVQLLRFGLGVDRSVQQLAVAPHALFLLRAYRFCLIGHRLLLVHIQASVVELNVVLIKIHDISGRIIT